MQSSINRSLVRKIVIPVSVVSAMLISATGQAADKYDRARVVDVQPVYENVRYEVPVEQCYQERVAVPTRRAGATPTILGAIIGGALGNAVGHNKRNKQVGTVVGAVLGGSIGADVSRHRNTGHADARYRTEEVCETTYESRHENRLSGYNVKYEYAGTTYQTRMDRDPGDFVRVSVRVRPAY